jgi:Flp pilus assembly protein TadG
MTNRPRNRRRGSTLIESALIFSTFLFMIIGVLDFGQFLYLHQAITERARSAARFGALQPFDINTTPAQIQNMVIYNSPTVPAVATGDPTFGLTPAMVNVTAIGPNNDIRVFISGYPYQVFSPYIGGTYYGPNIIASSASENVS